MESDRYAGNVSNLDSRAAFGDGSTGGVGRQPLVRYTLPARTSPPQLFTRVSRRWGSFPIHPSALSLNGIRDGRGGRFQPLTMVNGSGCGKRDTTTAAGNTDTTAATTTADNTPTATTRTRILCRKPSFMSRSFRKLCKKLIPETTTTPFAGSLAPSSSSSSSSSSSRSDGSSSLRIPFPSAPPVLRQRPEKAGHRALSLVTPPPLRSATTWMTPGSNSEAFPTGWGNDDEQDNDGVGRHGAAKPAVPAPWGEEGGDGDDETFDGFQDVGGLGGVTGQSSSKNKRDESGDGMSNKPNATAPDAAAVADGTGVCSGGSGDQSHMDLSPGVDDGWGSWVGAGRSTPPRTSRSPASSPGLTPLRGRSRRGWWRRRRAKYPTDN